MSAGKEKSLAGEERQLSKRLAEIDRLFAALYEDKVMEKITQRNYDLLTAKYEQEQAELQGSLSRIRQELSEKEEKEKGITDFIEMIKGYAGLKELNATILNTLIDRILIYEREEGKDGKLTQDIEIHYKFVGTLDDIHISPTERYMEYDKVHICEECGGEYAAKTPAAKYCPSCRDKVRARQAAEGYEWRRQKRAAERCV